MPTDADQGDEQTGTDQGDEQTDADQGDEPTGTDRRAERGAPWLDDPDGSIRPAGTTLLVGPSNVGKTTRTARALEAWVAARGARGVVVFDFGPELERDGRLLGGRLGRFTDLLDDAEPISVAGRTTVRRSADGLWYGVLDAHAPRTEGGTATEAVTLARENARGAARLLARAPSTPRAVFVNDATIALQHPTGDPDRLLSYCARADAAVVNAFESDELGTDDRVSRQERGALDALVAGADRVVRLP
nr:hypothetical protein [Salinigranum marinum]